MPIEIAVERLAKVAGVMVNDSLKVAHSDNLLVVYHPGGQQFADMVSRLAEDMGANIRLQREDSLEDAKFLTSLGEHATEDAFEEIVSVRMENANWADKFAMIRCVEDSNPMVDVAYETRAAFNRALAPVAVIRGQKEWILTSLPTRMEADLDNIPYKEYANLYLQACGRPWREVEKAQDILIEMLNPGRVLELQAQGTFLTMSIEGQTFANSTITRNIPGGEIFTGPVRGTVEGRLVLPYRLMFKDKVIPNLTLEFSQGRIVKFLVDGEDNEANMDCVEQVLNTDEGAKEVGEVAFGTNSVLNRPLVNPLFVEKVGGSFHLALGRSYEYTYYAGREVKVDNGVRSANHIDVTCMMLPKYGGGLVSVDGKVISKDGRFIDPRLKILNQRQNL